MYPTKRRVRSNRTLLSRPPKRWQDWRRWVCLRCIHGVRVTVIWSIRARIIIDLDPDAAIPWTRLAESAADVRKELKKLGLESFLKSTGGKGLHVVVPIIAEYDWTVIKQVAHAFVLQMEKEEPTLYLTKMSKAARRGRIFLDYLRNERGATAVAAFSPRARVGGPVSLPLNWNDLKLPERPVARAADFEEWKGRLNRDPWKQFFKSEQRIPLNLLRTFKISPSK